MSYKKISTLTVGLLLSLGLWLPVFAALPIPENLKGMAEELGCNTKESCKTAFEANFSHGLELANKYGAYDLTPEKKKLAESFQKEVLTKLSKVSPEDLEQKIIELASSILKNKPSLAKQLSIEQKEVRAAEVVIKEVKSAGVSLTVCSRPADKLSREELVGCLEASRNLVEKKEATPVLSRDYAGRSQNASGVVELQEAMARGEYSELGNTPDQLGESCLKPNSPVVCDEIAKKYFGPSGLAELERARKQVRGVEDSYTKKTDNLTLSTTNGEKIVGKEAIRARCDAAFNSRDVDLARACGELAIKNGFLSKEEFDKNFKFFESVSDIDNVDFSRCARDPKSCESFLPVEHREEFQASQQVEDILAKEIGFSSRECAKGDSNQEIGQKCFEGSKRALPKLEELALKYPSVARMVTEIRSHIDQGEEYSKRRDEVGGDIRKEGGPGGCRNESDCRVYCSDPEHGPECIAFGAKSGLFKVEDVSRRFNEYNDTVKTTQPIRQTDKNRDDFYQRDIPLPAYEDEGGVQKNHNNVPSPECMKAISSGDFARAKETCNAFVSRPVEQPVKPVCPAMPTVDSCSEGQRRVVSYSSPECGTYYSCSSEEKPIEKKVEEPKPDPIISPICPAVHSVDSCSEGYKRVAYQSAPGCGTYYGCERDGSQKISPPTGQQQQIWNSYGLQSWIRNDTSQTRIASLKAACENVKSNSANIWMPGAGDSSSIDFGMPSPDKCEKAAACTSSQYFDGSSCVLGSGTNSWKNDESMKSACAKALGVWDATANYCKMPNSYSASSSVNTNTSSMSKCFYTNASKSGAPVGFSVWCESDYYNCHEGTKDGPSFNTVGVALGAPSQCEGGWSGGSSGSSSECASAGGSWNSSSNYCNMPNSSSGSSCTSGQYWNGSACVTSSSVNTNTPTPVTDSQTNPVTATTTTTTVTVPEASSAATTCETSGGMWYAGYNYCEMPSCGPGFYWAIPASGGWGSCKSTTGSSAGTQTSTSVNTSGGSTAGTSGGSSYPSGSTSSGMSKCFYTNASKSGAPVGFSVWCESDYYNCHEGTKDGPSFNTVGVALGAPSQCEGGWSGGSSGSSSECASAGGSWNSSSNYCNMPSSTYTGTSGSSCTGSQYWNGSACVTSSSDSGYSMDPATGCAQAGGTWSSSSNYCQMPNSSSGSGSPYSSCTTGQYWNGTACVTSYNRSPDSLLGQLLTAIKGLFRK